MFNSFSKLETKEEQQVWTCEFCNSANEVMLDDAEIPKGNSMTYMLQAAA